MQSFYKYNINSVDELVDALYSAINILDDNKLRVELAELYKAACIFRATNKDEH